MTLVAGEDIKISLVYFVANDGKAYVYRGPAEDQPRSTAEAMVRNRPLGTAIRDIKKGEVVPVDPETGRLG